MAEQNRPVFMLFAVWRLLAAILVMLYHFFGIGPEAYRLFAVKAEVLSHLLDLFFIVSGFLIWIHYEPRLQTRTDYKAFLARRFARLYPLHLVTLSFFCLVWAAVGLGLVTASMTNSYTFAELIKELLLINAWGLSDTLTFNYVSWSLSAEWFCYLLFPVLIVTFHRLGLAGLILLLGASVLALEGFTWLGLMPFPTWLQANTWGAYRVFADFVLGAVIANIAMRRMVPVTSQLWPWASFVCALLVMFAHFSWGYWSMIAIAITLFLAAQVEINNPRATAWMRPILPLANMSFGIYLWHPVIGSLALSFFWTRYLAPNNLVPFGPMAALSCVLCIVTAIISARYFEAPLRRLILAGIARRMQSKGEEKPHIALVTPR